MTSPANPSNPTHRPPCEGEMTKMEYIIVEIRPSCPYLYAVVLDILINNLNKDLT